jgi:predicted metal-dependent enzyme (double-stranded beta helix superfamily)
MTTVRDCARAIIDAVSARGDERNLVDAIREPLEALMARDDLESIGVPRQGNNVASSQYLYFDGELSILLFDVPVDRPIPPHDHGVWEAFCVYKGSVHHKVWQRSDNGTVPGRADLELVADEVLGPGDVAVVAPPADIHGFSALEAGTVGLTVVNGAYKDERLYYQPEAGTCVARRQTNRH